MIISVIGNTKSGKDTVARMCQYFSIERGIRDINPVLKDYLLVEQERVNNTDWYNDFYKSLEMDEIIKFSSPIKEIAALMTGMTLEDMENQDIRLAPIPELGGVTLIQLLQDIGMFGRAYDKDYWVNKFKKAYLSAEEEPNVINTDCRFPSEQKALLGLNSITIKVVRPTEQRFPELWKAFKKKNQPIQEWELFLTTLPTPDGRSMYDIIYAESEKYINDLTYDFLIHNDGTLMDLFEKLKNKVFKNEWS